MFDIRFSDTPLRKWMLTLIVGISLCGSVIAVEPGRYRLLSVSESSKLILVSQIPSKTKYILDATSAKITVNDKPAEFKDLKDYSVVQVILDLRKTSKDGIDIDGTASEIRVDFPEHPK